MSKLLSLFCNRKKLELHKKLCKNKGFYISIIIMPFKDTKILEFNQYQKTYKARFVIYADLDCIVEMFGGCKNNPESSSARK